MCSCTHREKRNNEATYRSINSQFEHGQLLLAGKAADENYHRLEAQDPEWAAKFRILEGEILVWRGLSQDSLALLQADLPAPVQSDEIAVRRYVALGLAHCFLQQFESARDDFSHADVLARTSYPNLMGEIALARGTSFLLQNNLPDADREFHASLDASRREKHLFWEANSLGSLGLVAMRQQHYDQATDWLYASLAVTHSIGNSVQEEKTLGNLGWCYYKLGDFDNALSLFKRAIAVCTEQGLAKDQQIWLSNSGLVYSTLGNFDQGERDYATALAIARKLENKALITITLNNLAQLEFKRNNVSQAQAYSREALKLSRDNRFRGSELYARINEGLIAVSQKRYSDAQGHLRYVIANAASDLPLKWEAQSILAETHTSMGLVDTANIDFLTAMRTIDQARSSLSKTDYRLSFLNTATDFYNDYIDFLVLQNRIEDALAVAEHSRARTLAEGLGFKPASLEDRSAPPTETARRQHAVILAYWLKPEHSYLWAITPTKVALFKLPADAEINAAVQTYRKALTGPRDPLETAIDSGRLLYQMLVAPAAKFIPSKSRVVIIADGSLYGLNFETLLAPTPKPHYWIDDVTISNANSLAMLRTSPLGRQQNTKPSLLLIGNPVSASPDFPSLPQAQEEIREVAAHFSIAEKSVIDGVKATPASYLNSDPSNFSYIHFVAHGTASRLSPLDSAVILSPQGDSYKLYARDIVEKPLGAELVTISACYGSGSRSYSGEGLVGLSWAFLRAGARNVIASLWEANDVSTSRLMDSMYTAISQGDDPATALHTAKLAMLHSDSVYRRPFYWAPFQIYVGPGQMQASASEVKTAAIKIGAGKTR